MNKQKFQIEDHETQNMLDDSFSDAGLSSSSARSNSEAVPTSCSTSVGGTF